MDKVCAYVTTVAKDPFLFEYSYTTGKNGSAAQEPAYSAVRVVSPSAQHKNRSYMVLYALLSCLRHFMDLLTVLVLIRHLGIQIVNLFGTIYLFHSILILAPVTTLSHAAHITLAWVNSRGMALSFALYSLIYVLLSLVFTCTMATICTVFGQSILAYLMGDMAPLCTTIYYTSLWISATLLTLCTCIHTILISEGRSVILPAALVSREFFRALAFMMAFFYSSMEMLPNLNYWTTVSRTHQMLPTTGFFYKGVLYLSNKSHIPSGVDDPQIMAIFSPYIETQAANTAAQRVPIRIHLYSYHISVAVSCLAFLVTGVALVRVRTKAMGWKRHEQDPIVASLSTYMHAIKNHRIYFRGFWRAVWHLAKPWVPLYIDRVSNLGPLLLVSVSSAKDILLMERTTTTIMKFTLFYMLSDIFNAFNHAIVELYISEIVTAHMYKMYRTEVAAKGRAMMLCVAGSILSFIITLQTNFIVYAFMPNNYKNLNSIEQLWLVELYGEYNLILLYVGSNVLMGAHMLLLTHLVMENKLPILSALAVKRLFYCMLFTFTRTMLSDTALIRELSVSNILISVISMMGFALSTSKYSVLIKQQAVYRRILGLTIAKK